MKPGDDLQVEQFLLKAIAFTTITFIDPHLDGTNFTIDSDGPHDRTQISPTSVGAFDHRCIDDRSIAGIEIGIGNAYPKILGREVTAAVGARTASARRRNHQADRGSRGPQPARTGQR